MLEQFDAQHKKREVGLMLLESRKRENSPTVSSESRTQLARARRIREGGRFETEGKRFRRKLREIPINGVEGG